MSQCVLNIYFIFIVYYIIQYAVLNLSNKNRVYLVYLLYRKDNRILESLNIFCRQLKLDLISKYLG